MKEDKKYKNSKLVNKIIETFINGDSVKFDPNGSYTGKCEDSRSTPVQDQDDL